MAGVGVFPGSFNPPTVAHLSMASAVCTHYGLARLDLMVSRKPLAKEDVGHPRFDHRMEILQRAVAGITEVSVVETDRQLLSDIGAGYDLMLLGADKWHQIQQVTWYGTVDQRDEALARLPTLVVFPRSGFPDPPPEVAIARQLVPSGIRRMSSTRARSGELHLMAPEARVFAQITGAWIDPERYDRWLAASNGDANVP